MLAFIIRSLIRCLVLTIIIELSLSIILGVRKLKDITNVILVNILTNPALVSTTFFINILYGVVPRRIAIVILEILAVIIEGFIYKKCLDFKRINPYKLSLVLNVISYSIGLAIDLL